MSEELKTDSLRRAITQLEEALSLASEELRLLDSRYRLHLRAGAIQAFEYTYELCERILRRSLRLSESGEARVSELTFGELFRLGHRRGLVKGDIRRWLSFRESRNRTSHTYSEEDAQAVFEAIPEFLDEARFLLDALGRMSLRERESEDLDIEPIDLALVCAILARTLAPVVRVVVFGSRATGRAERGSDLDLAVDAGRPLTMQERGTLKHDFVESELPYEVDILDIRTVDDDFREIVERDGVPLPGWNAATRRERHGSENGGGKIRP